MTKRLALVTIASCLVVSAARLAAAQTAPAAPPPAPAPEASPPPPPPPPPPEAMSPPLPAQSADAAGPAVGESAEPAVPLVRYGIGLRFPRWVSVPSWFLGIFTAQNVPLSTFKSFGAEFFRRKGDLDITFGLSYQNMSPADGNWLGKSKDPSIDTDFVQFRDFYIFGLDAAFIWHQQFNRYIGMHYGAGIGLAFVHGDMLRISNSAQCTKENAGDERACRPKICPEAGCTETMLKNSEGRDLGPDSPARYKDTDVPSAVPILNVLLGFDFRFPELKGFEARVEGGFYDAFFVGMGFGYVF